MMDCRQALQILEFNDGVAARVPCDVYSTDDRAAAEAHLESCPACARIVHKRRELDRTIGQVMRAAQIPRGAQQRLLARLFELEIADSGSAAGQPAAVLEMAGSHDLNGSHSSGEELARNGQPSSAAASSVQPARPSNMTARGSRRRFLKGLVPLGVCLVVAMIGFFGVVWFFMPRWTVDDISNALAKMDFETLGTQADFTGNNDAARFPSEPGWERLQWQCGRQAKGLSVAPNVIAVYGFDVPERGRPGSVRGLIAVIPRDRVRNPPTAVSLAMASPSGYLSARIGDSVCVAWQQGDVVCVCLIQGGADSLGTLLSALGEPAA